MKLLYLDSFSDNILQLYHSHLQCYKTTGLLSWVFFCSRLSWNLTFVITSDVLYLDPICPFSYWLVCKGVEGWLRICYCIQINTSCSPAPFPWGMINNFQNTELSKITEQSLNIEASFLWPFYQRRRRLGKVLFSDGIILDFFYSLIPCMPNIVLLFPIVTQSVQLLNDSWGWGGIAQLLSSC